MNIEQLVEKVFDVEVEPRFEYLIDQVYDKRYKENKKPYYGWIVYIIAFVQLVTE